MPKYCAYFECKKQPTFAFEGDKPLFCGTHRQKGMIYIHTKRCHDDECTKVASFAFQGQKPTSCVSHRVDGMINVVLKCCQHTQCIKRPNFAFEGNKPLFCGKHRQHGMIDVVHKRCQHTECTKSANFAFQGDKATHCSSHCVDGMININIMYTKHCQQDECTKVACFAFEGIPLFCKTHCLEGMFDVKTKRCEHDNCKKQPSFAFQGGRRALCGTHCLKGMINMKNKRCKTQGCDVMVHPRNNRGYCIHCFMHLFPNEKIAKNYKVKENEVLNSIVDKFSSVTVIQDRRIQGGCSLRRPDVLIDLGYQVLIIETDENQHKTYDCSCENKRIMELSRDVGHRNLVFIRFNPDDYMKNGVKINSCFSRTKLGFLVIPKAKQVEWQQRLNVLHETIEYWIQNKTDKTIEVVELFFDTM